MQLVNSEEFVSQLYRNLVKKYKMCVCPEVLHNQERLTELVRGR